MTYVQNILKGIKTTDFTLAMDNLKLLKQIPFEKLSAPLSLLYDLINGISDGREDFINSGFRELLYHDIRLVAQQVFISIASSHKYVSKKTKSKTLDTLFKLQKNLNPNNDICHQAFLNLQYAIFVIEALPENKDVVWDSLMLLFTTLKIIATRDGESIKYFSEVILNNLNEIKNKSILEQISIVDSLEYIILEKKQINKFKKIYNLYLTTNSIYVKSKIILFMGKLCRLYYGGYLSQDFSNIAYKSFTKLLEIVSSRSKVVVDKSWLIKCSALEMLILLENRLKDKMLKRQFHGIYRN